MKYERIVTGIFIKRLNRFIAEVSIDGVTEQVHVKNTGRCKELFIAGQKVYLEKASNPERKTKYSLISIYKGGILVNVDSQVPNRVIYDALLENRIPGFEDLEILKREYTYDHSRFDLYFKRKNGQEGFIEVKGVTLERDGYATFPDAPTQRGTKHTLELAAAIKDGYESYILFLIQLRPVSYFTPNALMDPDFAEAIKFAKENGVGILAYDALIDEETIVIGQAITVKI